MKSVIGCLLCTTLCLAVAPALGRALPKPAQIDAQVATLMQRTGAQGLAIAIIDRGQPVYMQAYGKRNAQGDPLTVDTVMYGASLTKTVFAYTVMRWVGQKRIALDTSIADDLPQPLPQYTGEDLVTRYTDWSALDERWRKLTPRILLQHASGFANFGFLEPDEKLHFHFDPSTRYAYSGDGLATLQFVLEQGRGLDVGQGTDAVFAELGMTRTALKWRPDFAGNLADGWDANGKPAPHDERSRVRAAGSMDTTIRDLARFAAALVAGRGIGAREQAEMLRPQRPITTRSQFPTLQPELPPAQRRKDLSAGLGVVTFEGPQGPGFFKGGHNDTTGNTLVCLRRQQRCVLVLGNDVRAEKGFAELVEFVLGKTGVPYGWEYGTS
ncbi:serine hydrolase domain-containing protein [Pseudoxanthomonas winnipegensis]|uniref:Class A beta-lactamase-related serine hydrolase n=1 Tax=Pseudoxanthomonas winnipegensis TaxID=2480810 RepID=A0A4V2HEX6_9GAMM|nr:serine hydrolase domain-containing protein [Pseudoxanthomonas winnipegensis]TAA34905.1 class A beta-lactamase-related serine hydrolase [Pseudoxanthomonas winnipegensis]